MPISGVGPAEPTAIHSWTLRIIDLRQPNVQPTLARALQEEPCP